jgi:AraC family transcriptional regulator
MVLHEFPDLQWLKRQAETNFVNREAWQGPTLPQTGWPTVVMNVKTSQTFRDNIRGPLSLFTNLAGVSQVYIEKKSAKINPGFFFLSNDAQHYTLDINNKRETETLNIHFGQHWVDETLRSLTSREEELLDESYFSAPFERFEFYNKIYEHDASLSALLIDLKNSGTDKLRQEERLYDVLVTLLRTDRQVKKLERSIPAMKNSTRKEIVRRLTDSTDFIYSNFNKEISLDELANIACLSKFHFLRLFKSAFQKTPHQFINELKVRQATHWLKEGVLNVRESSKALGFKDSSTFSRLYFNHTGVYPSQVL